jgi:hypothetical protein
MALTVTTAANTIREAYAPGFNEAVFRNHSLFNMFTWQDAVGDTAFRWKLNSAGNDSVEVFTEGQGQPDAGNQTFVNAAVSWTYFRGMLSISGHARDALKSNWVNHVDEEAILLRSDLIDLMTTSFMGGTYGLELAVDYGSAYAGITRNGAAGYFESTETAVGQPVSTTDLQDLEETIEDNDKAGVVGAWLVPRNQTTRIYNLAGPHVIYNQNVRDKYPGMNDQTINGRQVISLPDWTNTVIMAIDTRDSNWAPRQIRPFSVKEMGPSGDSDLMQLSWGGCLAVKMPKYMGKLTGCDA